MSFTYDLTTDIGKVRLWLGDITQGRGMRPDGSNISDEEIALILDQERDTASTQNTIMRAVAACCELLANAWSSVAGNITIGSRSEAHQQAEQFARRAAALRAQYGGTALSFSVAFMRNDGYEQKDDHVGYS